jgi:hypothetical protein
MELGRSSWKGIQFMRQLVEDPLVGRDQSPRNAIDIVLKGDARMALDESLDTGEKGAAFLEEQVMMGTAKVIPFAIVMPSASTVRFVDMTLTREDVIR